MRIGILIILLLSGSIVFSQKNESSNKMKDSKISHFQLEGKTAADYLKDNIGCKKMAEQIEKGIMENFDPNKEYSEDQLKCHYNYLMSLAYAKGDYTTSLKNLNRLKQLQENDTDMKLVLREAYLRAKLNPDINSEKDLKLALEKNLCNSLIKIPHEQLKSALEDPLAMMVLENGGFIKEYYLEGGKHDEGVHLFKIPEAHALQLLISKMDNEIIAGYSEDVYKPVLMNYYTSNLQNVNH